jgi:hypothetical protein
MGKP